MLHFTIVQSGIAIKYIYSYIISKHNTKNQQKLVLVDLKFSD